MRDAARFRWARLLALVAVMVLALLPIWAGLGDHPLHQRSESRYARVAQTMLHPPPEAEAGEGDAAPLERWLIPRHDGRPHLTKPPLTYWLIAASQRGFGENEFAVRFPSALAASATLLLVGLVARRLYGSVTAVVSVALLSVMPVFVVVARLGITDALLGLCWVGALAFGVLHARRVEASEQPKWTTVFAFGLWLFVAVGLLNKGPIALLPAGLVMLWLLVARRWAVLRSLRVFVGLGLACVPLLLWAGYVVWWSRSQADMDAGNIWWYEIVDRAAGTGDHPQPWWYLLPVFVVGLFPAVTQWPVPGVHVRWKRVAEAVRAGSPVALWAAGLLAPLVLFTLFSGKLMSYVLPSTACGALLAGPVLAAWVRDRAGRETDEKPAKLRVGGFTPIVVVVMAAALAWGVVWSVATAGEDAPAHGVLGGAGDWIARFVPAWLTWAVPVWSGGVVVAWVLGGTGRLRRSGALLLAWAATAGLYVSAALAESRVFGVDSTPMLVEAVKQHTGFDRPAVRTVGYADPSLAFYTGRDTSRVDPRFTPEEWNALDRQQLVLVAEPAAWEGFEATNPRLIRQRYEPLGTTRHQKADGGEVWVFAVRRALW